MQKRVDVCELDGLCECKQLKGENLYNLYCDWVDNVSFNGEPLKKFSELPDKIKTAWTMAALNKKRKDRQEERDVHKGEHDFIGIKAHVPQGGNSDKVRAPAEKRKRGRPRKVQV